MSEDIETYKIWKLVGDEMAVVQTMTTWKARAQEQATFLTRQTGCYHTAVVGGSDYDKKLLAERIRKQQGAHPMKWNESLPLDPEHLPTILGGLELVLQPSLFRLAVLREHDAETSHLFPPLTLSSERGIDVFEQDHYLILQMQAHEVGQPESRIVWATNTYPVHPEYTPQFLFAPEGKILVKDFLHVQATQEHPERFIASMALFIRNSE